MEFAQVLARRHMVRAFRDEPLAAPVRQRLLAASLRGPSAGFTQGCELLVLHEPEQRAAFWREAAPNDASPRYGAMRTAPMITVFWCDEERYRRRYAEKDKGQSELPWSVPFWFVDAGMAALLMLLAAVDEGLGACFLGIPRERSSTLGPAFGVPGDRVPLGAVLIGHPDEGSAPPSPSLQRGRRPVDETVHWGRW